MFVCLHLTNATNKKEHITTQIAYSYRYLKQVWICKKVKTCKFIKKKQ